MRERNETAYNLVMQINEIKPEQWGPWDEQDYQRIDAAIRRAKAEVLEDLSNLLTYSRFNSYEQRMCERGCGLTKEGRIGASIGLTWALGEIDARAAQIEEGEDLK